MLSTAVPGNFTLNSTVSGGNVISDGNAVIISKGVCWSTNHNPTIADNKTDEGDNKDSFSSLITGLNASTLYYVRAYAINACGTSYGEELVFRTYSDSITDIDGNPYYTIIIGNLEWMAENLKVTKYRNGDPIPNISDNAVWQNITTGAYSNFNNDEQNSIKYGRIYNWNAVGDNRHIAPEGWHVASNEEWLQLVNSKGGEMLPVAN